MRTSFVLSLLPVMAWFVACGSDELDPSDTTGGRGGSSGSQNMGGSAEAGSDGIGGASQSEGGAGGSDASDGGDSAAAGSGGAAPAELKYGEYGFFPSTIDATSAEDAFDAWKAAQVETCGSNGARVKSDAGETLQTFSEGIGQGALLAAAWKDKTLFDGLWTYYSKVAAISDEKRDTDIGLMGFWVGGDDPCDLQADTTAVYESTTSHADIDMAMALLNAECTWGGGDYLDGATQIITALKDEVATTVDGKTLIRSFSDSDGTCFKPAYAAPGFFRVFAQAIPAQATFWNKAANDSYSFLTAASHATTGMAGDWASGADICLDADGFVGYDAHRTTWRVATDYAWFETAAAETWLNKLFGWFDGEHGAESVSGAEYGFHTHGTNLSIGSGDSSTAGMFALSAFASDQETSDAYHAGLADVPEVNDDGYHEQIARALFMTFAANKFGMGCY